MLPDFKDRSLASLTLISRKHERSLAVIFNPEGCILTLNPFFRTQAQSVDKVVTPNKAASMLQRFREDQIRHQQFQNLPRESLFTTPY